MRCDTHGACRRGADCAHRRYPRLSGQTRNLGIRASLTARPGTQPSGSVAVAVAVAVAQSEARRNRSALLITDTDDKLIAAAASIGESMAPNSGYNTPAAIGTPAPL